MLVTGATGFLGRHLVNGPPTARWQVLAPASRAMDIRRRDSTIANIRDSKPHAVVHLAYRRDDRATIEDGSRNVAEGAAAAGAHLVHMSTDVVFGGRGTPYTERDHPTPITPYGHHKFAAEGTVAAVHPGAVIVRTSLIYGTERPSPAQEALRHRLRADDDATATTFFTDEYRCPVHAGDLADAIALLAGRPEVSGPLHVSGPERVSRAQLAELMARHLGFSAARLPTGTIAESGLTRPANVVLDVSAAADLGITCRPVSTVLT